MKKFAFLLIFSSIIFAQHSYSYTVKAGDTLYAIASSYATSVSELKRINGLSGDFLEIGQVLTVPVTTQQVSQSSQTAATPQRAGIIQHTVGVGHTLANLGQMYNLSEATLRASNPGLENILIDTPLSVGLVLQIPPAEGKVLLVEEKQNLMSIALQHGIKAPELAKANNVKTLHAGQYVFIPAGYDSVPQRQSDTVQMVSKQDVRDMHLQAQRNAIARAASLLAVHTPVVASVQSFIWPVQGQLTSLYGRRNISVGGNTFHSGVDVASPTGTPIAAAKAGTVVKAGWGGAYGYVVYIDHGDGTQTRYAHMSQIKVEVGRYVNQRDIVGLVGSTGASTGPHLHFEIRLEGRSVDPLGYLQVR
jgi:murein DD-endopeptidase MepM/ murein hydrolase activator NlpD